MGRKKQYNQEIDSVDFKNIAIKSEELTKLIFWLERLSAIDPTVDKRSITAEINHLKTKRSTLEKKRQKAEAALTEEAEFIAGLYKGL